MLRSAGLAFSSIALLTALGCASPGPVPLMSAAVRPRPLQRTMIVEPSSGAARQTIVEQARQLLSGGPPVVRGLTFESDPVGFVRAAYWAAELDLFAPGPAANPSAHGMEILFRSAAERECLHYTVPSPGDLVFLDATGRRTELYPAQVAIVERVDADGTITALGAFKDGPRRVTMNLRRPDVTLDAAGARLNDLLDGKESATVARVFRAFADPFRKL